MGRPGVNKAIWLRDDDDPDKVAYFKYADPVANQYASLYSIGFERVAYTLAEELDMPVVDTHLEEFEGLRGVLTRRVPGDSKSWDQREADIADARPTFLDRDMWPLYVAFDILVANPDRHDGNVFVEWDPPGRGTIAGEVCTTWLIDFGFGGLWPPQKFGATDPEAVDPTADYDPQWLEYGRQKLLGAYRQAFPPLGDARRREVVEDLHRITEDLVVRAVHEVPRSYMSDRAAGLTVELLLSRLSRIDTLIDTVLPA